MRCPECVKQDLRSTLQLSGGGHTTLLGWAPYYDEDGSYHAHNPNRTTGTAQCSNNHRLIVITIQKCPSCEYGGLISVTLDSSPAPEPRVYLGRLGVNQAAGKALGS